MSSPLRRQPAFKRAYIPREARGRLRTDGHCMGLSDRSMESRSSLPVFTHARKGRQEPAADGYPVGCRVNERSMLKLPAVNHCHRCFLLWLPTTENTHPVAKNTIYLQTKQQRPSLTSHPFQSPTQRAAEPLLTAHCSLCIQAIDAGERRRFPLCVLREKVHRAGRASLRTENCAKKIHAIAINT